MILTLGCGKFRFNKQEFGTVAGLPRLLDIGQCNDSYSAIQIALALSQAFGCGVNELPLSLIISWYEQKAVAVLLTLLHLGVRNIRIGPTLPAFGYSSHPENIGGYIPIDAHRHGESGLGCRRWHRFDDPFEGGGGPRPTPNPGSGRFSNLRADAGPSRDRRAACFCPALPL